MRKTLFLFLIAAVGVFGCSTDIEINAPYKATTVVFGLLDPAVDTQFVKINKTWLGDGNNFDYAAIRDSSEYSMDEFNGIYVHEVEGNSTTTFELQSMEMQDKDEDGIFYGPEYTVYFFVTPGGLNEDARYDLEIDFKSKEDVYASTDIIKSEIGNITQPPFLAPPAGPATMGFATVANVTIYPNYTLKWSSTENAKRYELSFLIYYTEKIWNDLEHTDLVSSEVRTLDWFISSQQSTGIDGNELMDKQVNGELFFRHLGNKLDVDPYITREIGLWDADIQKVKVMDFLLTIGNDELNTYMEINEPVTGIIQERPEYTNISNGLGLFASRSEQGIYGLGITAGTLEALIEGEFTAELNFCTPNPFNDFYCGN